MNLTGYNRKCTLINRLRLLRFISARSLTLKTLILCILSVMWSCSEPPYYTRFIDIDSKSWSKMATVEFFPMLEDSTFTAPKQPVTVILTLRHTSGHPYKIPLELCSAFKNNIEVIDTLNLEVGNSRSIRKDGGYGLEITQIPLLISDMIDDDFHLSVSPVDSVVGLHSIGLTIISPSSANLISKQVNP